VAALRPMPSAAGGVDPYRHMHAVTTICRVGTPARCVVRLGRRDAHRSSSSTPAASSALNAEPNTGSRAPWETGRSRLSGTCMRGVAAPAGRSSTATKERPDGRRRGQDAPRAAAQDKSASTLAGTATVSITACCAGAESEHTPVWDHPAHCTYTEHSPRDGLRPHSRAAARAVGAAVQAVHVAKVVAHVS
jgi:hypothetical protein